MNDLIVKDNEIKNMIHEIHGKQVILDSDLAKLYQCKNGTKMINQTVSRNLERFPEDFYFQLSEEDLIILRSQVGTTKFSERFMFQLTDEKSKNLRFQFETSKVRSGKYNKPYDLLRKIDEEIAKEYTLL